MRGRFVTSRLLVLEPSGMFLVLMKAQNMAAGKPKFCEISLKVTPLWFIFKYHFEEKIKGKQLQLLKGTIAEIKEEIRNVTTSFLCPLALLLLFYLWMKMSFCLRRNEPGCQNFMKSSNCPVRKGHSLSTSAGWRFSFFSFLITFELYLLFHEIIPTQGPLTMFFLSFQTY